MAEEEIPTVAFGEQLMVFFEAGQLEEAEDFAEEYIDSIRARLGSDDDLEGELALALESQSDFFRALGDNQRAEMGYHEALHFLRRNDGYEADRGRINSSLAVMFDFSDQPEQAKSYYEKAIKLFQGVEPVPVLDIADFENNLAYIFEAEGELDEAEACFRRSLTLTQQALGLDDRNTAMRYNNLGTHYFKRDRREQAKELHLTALNVRRRILGEDHVETADSLHNFALVLTRMGKVDEGLKHFEMSLDAFEKNLDTALDDYETVAANYGDVLESLGEKGSVNDLENRVREAVSLMERAG